MGLRAPKVDVALGRKANEDSKVQEAPKVQEDSKVFKEDAVLVPRVRLECRVHKEYEDFRDL